MCSQESERSELASEAAPAGPQLVIWGTDVVVSQCKEKFRKFMMKYVDKSIADDEQFDGIDANSPYYLQRLDEVSEICL